MAIEFNCPYCTATIRVPDPYAGKQGRCPKCDTRLLVPLMTLMTLSDSSTSAPEQTESTQVPASIGVSLPTSQTAEDAVLPTAGFAIRPPAAKSATSRRRRGRRRPSRTLVLGIPVIGFLVLLGLTFYSVIRLPELNGQLTAKRMAALSLPRVTIPWTDTGLEESDRETLKKFLEATPEVLSSQILTCRLIGADAGIEILLTAGTDSQWIAVDSTTHKPLALWLKKERPALNVRRINALKENLASYCRDKLAQISGDRRPVDAVMVRDGVAFNAAGGAFGSVVVAALVDRLVPCACEDDQGILYFCLPKGTQAFQIIGRTFENGNKLFAGNYNIIVSSEDRAVEKGSIEK